MSVSSSQSAERTADELGNLEQQIEGQNLQQQLIPPTHKIDAGQDAASADDSNKNVASLQAEFDSGSKPSTSAASGQQHASPRLSPVSLQSASAGQELAMNPTGSEKLELPPQQDNVWATKK